MKNINLPEFISWSNPVPLVRKGNLPIVGLRQFLGLPELSDTEKNTVVMHNETLENEASYFAKHMGSKERSAYTERKNEKKNTPCVGREFGF